MMRRKSSQNKGRPLDEAAARERCLRLLSVRARSGAELRERLLQVGFSRSVIGRVLAGLAEAGLVDDEEFARSWIAGRKVTGIGRRRLRAELARKGIERGMIERLIAEQVDDETERGQVETLARRRLARSSVDARTLARLRRFLIGRGYGFEMVDDALRTIAGEEDAN
jgi:regulatory protein